MPKHKQYSHNYRRTIVHNAVQEIENNIQAHKSDEMIYSIENYNNCFLEINNDETNSISEITSDEIIQVNIQENSIPDIMQEAIVCDKFIPSVEYNNVSSSESDSEHNNINIDRLRKNLVKWCHSNNICRSAVTSLLRILKIEKACNSFHQTPEHS